METRIRRIGFAGLMAYLKDFQTVESACQKLRRIFLSPFLRDVEQK